MRNTTGGPAAARLDGHERAGALVREPKDARRESQDRADVRDRAAKPRNRKRRPQKTHMGRFKPAREAPAPHGGAWAAGQVTNGRAGIDQGRAPAGVIIFN